MASRRAATAAVGVRRLGAAAVQEEAAPLYPDAVLTAPETQQAKVCSSLSSVVVGFRREPEMLGMPAIEGILPCPRQMMGDGVSVVLGGMMATAVSSPGTTPAVPSPLATGSLKTRAVTATTTSNHH